MLTIVVFFRFTESEVTWASGYCDCSIGAGYVYANVTNATLVFAIRDNGQCGTGSNELVR